jgi:DNA-binding transcriptional ArsR family regulator
LTTITLSGNNFFMAQRAADLAPLLGALADPTRLQAVERLATRPHRAGELADELGVSPPAMSKHLRVLLKAGIVVDERLPEDARARVFRLRPDSVIVIRGWLDQLQAHWDEQLASFRAHLEGRIKR